MLYDDIHLILLASWSDKRLGVSTGGSHDNPAQQPCATILANLSTSLRAIYNSWISNTNVLSASNSDISWDFVTPSYIVMSCYETRQASEPRRIMAGELGVEGR
nr:hypothetical protein CFP56_76463 [Quercus suber]